MDCEVIERELAAYHFGVIEAAARDQVEGHLPACRACLGAFLALKRAIETAPDGPRPSEEARVRLRRAAASALDELAARRSPVRRWWRAGRVVLAAAGAAALGLLALRALEPPPPRGGALHDSARPSDESGRIL